MNYSEKLTQQAEELHRIHQEILMFSRNGDIPVDIRLCITPRTLAFLEEAHDRYKTLIGGAVLRERSS